MGTNHDGMSTPTAAYLHDLRMRYGDLYDKFFDARREYYDLMGELDDLAHEIEVATLREEAEANT